MKYENIINIHVRPGHFNAYGLRKGPATYAASGTTNPPPITSILLRGEWSMDIVLDAYFHFAQAGDFQLGRILVLLDPASPDFAVLPPPLDYFKSSREWTCERGNATDA